MAATLKSLTHGAPAKGSETSKREPPPRRKQKDRVALANRQKKAVVSLINPRDSQNAAPETLSEAITPDCPLTWDVEKTVRAALPDIFMLIAKGQSMLKICQLPGMPAREQVYKLLMMDPELGQQYKFACALKAECFVDETVAIADNGENDTYIDKKGEVKVDMENINRSRLRVDTRKWLASKMLPRQYGDSSTLEIGNKDGVGFEVQHLVIAAKDLVGKIRG